ncbi:MAG: hypothetical protein O7G85_09705 [Planctomycetota bacterium]|nr:hypothetical protein [Planctomycetota bacterium]
MRVANNDRWAGMGFCALLLSMVTTASGQGTFSWTLNGGGLYTNSANWTLTGGSGPAPPGIGDSAIFNILLDEYSVGFTGTTFSDYVQVSKGNVTFKSSGGLVQTFVITSGSADLLVSGGASLYIGNDVDVLNVIIADDLIVAGNSSMHIQTSSLVQAGDLILGGLGTGALYVKKSVLKIVGADSQDIGGIISSVYLFLDKDASG